MVDTAKFPDGIKPVADHIRAQEFVNSWADLYASWGVDYLKIDGVGAGDIPDVQAGTRRCGRPAGRSTTSCPTTLGDGRRAALRPRPRR
jgi:hypothetical protein